MQYGISYTKQSPTAATVGDSQLNIKVYPNIFPLMKSALTAPAINIRFCIFAGYEERGKQQIITVLLPYLIAACGVIRKRGKCSLCSDFIVFIYGFEAVVFGEYIAEATID